MKTLGSRLAGIIVALAAAVGLAGCSAIKLGYNSFPDLAYFWLDGYVDFTEQQEPVAKSELARLHAWHRQNELPKFVELLGRLEQIAPGPISPQQACAVVAEVQGRLQLVAERAEPVMVTLAATLQPRQLRHLERKYRGNNETFQKEWIHLDLAEQREKRYEQMRDRLEMIYGRLDDPQREVLRQAIATSMYDPQRILAERRRRQLDLLRTLRDMLHAGGATPQARDLLRGYLERAQTSPDAAYRAWQQNLLQEGCRIFAAVHESTTAAQREQAVRRLRAYQRDLRELSGQR